MNENRWMLAKVAAVAAVAWAFRLPGAAGDAGASAPMPWPQPPAAVGRLVDEALEANLSLQASRTDIDRAAARLTVARSLYLPRIDFVARYSRANGGRTIDIPVGDMLNPVYRTLNDLTGTSAFPQIENVSEPLLRSREQETKLRLTQPLYRPEIAEGRRAARARLAVSLSTVAAARRELRFQVQEAWFAHQRAQAAVRVFDSAIALVGESLRVDRALRGVDKVTDDVVLRAEAELAEVRQQQAAAVSACTLARAYLNQLLDRPFDEPVPTADAEMLDRHVQRLLELDLTAFELSTTHREELAALEETIHEARAGTAAAAAKRQPTVSLAVEGGTQGEDYHFGSGYNYALGSIVAEWNLFDSGERKAGIAAAHADEQRAALARRDVESRLALQLRQACERFALARTAIDAAKERVRASRAAYAVVAAREREGAAPQIVVLDARNTLTSAELSLELATCELFTAAAQLDRVAAITPLP